MVSSWRPQRSDGVVVKMKFMLEVGVKQRSIACM